MSVSPDECASALTSVSQELVARDLAAVWHPYSAAVGALPPFPVSSAEGVHLTLADGRRLIDGMASWWCVIHGYNHPVLNAAATAQLGDMSHVMFGGLTHAPAIRLAERLVDLTPEGLERVFFADAGSVAVEVAMKMAIQYWQARGRAGKQRFLALRGGYHGDTLHAMSVCDPVTGMHRLFSGVLPKQFFVPAPSAGFGQRITHEDIHALEHVLSVHAKELAALILEPVVQGAGGMRFYSPDYLQAARALCDRYGVLLIADEIATGFGRTGRLFACEHAGISPDILCVGKALTGGYMTLAATLCSARVADGIHAGLGEESASVLMHGPTFMANPLACAVSLASIRLLLSSPWQQRVQTIESQLERELAPCIDMDAVADVRVKGAIGVVEMHDPVDIRAVQEQLIEMGVWLRPFGRLLYTMPPYIMDSNSLSRVTAAMCDVAKTSA